MRWEGGPRRAWRWACIGGCPPGPGWSCSPGRTWPPLRTEDPPGCPRRPGGKARAWVPPIIMREKINLKTRHDKVILGEFRLFSANFSPIFCLWYPIRHFMDVYGNRLLTPISTYFMPKMVPHLCYKLKHSTHFLFFRPHVYGFCLFSAYIPLISHLTFCPFSACPVLPGNDFIDKLSQEWMEWLWLICAITLWIKKYKIIKIFFFNFMNFCSNAAR